MADYSVVNPPNAASYAAPLLDFRQLADIPTRYYTGKEKQAEIAMREAFPNGLPVDAKGNPDVAKIMDIGARTGGAQWVSPLLQMLIYSQGGATGAETLGGIAGQPGAAPMAPAGGPAAGPAPPVQPMPLPGGAKPPPIAANPASEAPTIRTMATEASRGADVMPAIGATARELRINPDAPLTPQQVEQVSPVLRRNIASPAEKTTNDQGGGPPFAPMIKRGEQTTQPEGATGRPAGAAPVPPTAPAAGAPAAPSPPAQAAGAPEPPPQRAKPNPYAELTGGMDPMDFIRDRQAKALRARQLAIQQGAANKPASATATQKQAEAWDQEAKNVIDLMAKNNELTTEQKNALSSGFASPAEMKRQETIDTELDKGFIDDMKEAIKAGGPSASKRIQLYDTVGQALARGNGNITTGPFAETALKAKQFVSSLFGVEIKGQTEAEMALKVGLQLASETVKALTPRPTQMELKLALQNNPGILLGTQGSLFMSDIGKQMARQEIALAKLAAHTKDPRTWPEQVEKFYAEHPLISPFTGKPIGEEDLKILANPQLNIPPKDVSPEQLQAATAGTPTAAPGGAAAPKQVPKFATQQSLIDAIRAGTVNAGDTIEFPEGTVTISKQAIDKYRPTAQQ